MRRKISARDLYADLAIEEAVIKYLWERGHGAWFVGSKEKKITAPGLTRVMRNVVRKCRGSRVSNKVIEDSIRLNLSTYGYDDKTFPVAHWMA
jgi:hypothetical protein